MAIALITGGGGAIGSASARALIRDGWRVVLADLDLSFAQEIVDEVGGGQASAIELDVTDFEAIHDAVAKIGALDGLVTMQMAGTGGKASGIVESYEERDSLVIERLRTEADRLEAAREAWIRCREVDTPEACTG